MVKLSWLQRNAALASTIEPMMDQLLLALLLVTQIL